MFKAEVQTHGDAKFYTNGLEFKTAEEAAVYADDLFCRWTQCVDWRVVEVFENGNQTVVITMAERLAK